MAARSAIINVITKACYKAARPLVRDFGEVEKLQVSRKGPGDFVSKADIRTDRILREELAFARPDFGFLTEEDAPVESTNFEGQRWIIDPVDGTTNFLHGIPFFVISVGLEQKGEIVAGVIYDPLRDELFHAEKGKGAYLNDQRVRVSGRQLLADCALATSHSFAGKPHHAEARALAADIGQRATVRDLGAAALHLAYVAAGRLDGFGKSGYRPGMSPPASSSPARPAPWSATSKAVSRASTAARSSPPTARSTAICSKPFEPMARRPANGILGPPAGFWYKQR